MIKRALRYCEDVYIRSRTKNVGVDRPMFIIGAPRSGTTILYNYLCKVMPVAYFAKAPSALLKRAHRFKIDYRGKGWQSVATSESTQNTLTALRARARARAPIPMLQLYPVAFLKLYTSIFRHEFTPIEGHYIWNVFLPTENHYTGEKTASPNAIRFYHKIVRSYLWYFGKTRFLNKCPRHTVRIPYLTSIFPDALFIHTIRDGRAVTRSVLEACRKFGVKFWGPKLKDWKSYTNREDIVTCALQWKGLVEEARRRSHDLESRYLEVRYEDFVANPRKVITEISEFCDIPVDLGRVNFENLKNMNYKWKRGLNEREKKLLEKYIGTFLQNLGYKNDFQKMTEKRKAEDSNSSSHDDAYLG